MIDEKQLAAWEALANAATPVPWFCSPEGFSRKGKPTPTVYAADDELRFVARCADFSITAENPTDNVANMRFISESRTALPALIAAYRELVAQSPAWHDRPTCPGLWVIESMGELWPVSESDLQRWQKHGWENGRVHGPIPADKEAAT